MFQNADLIAFWITFKLAFVTTFFLIIIALPLSLWLARSQSKLKIIIDAIIGLPLVLPPTVLGFYLLIFMGKNGPLANIFGVNLSFSFSGLVIGSMIYSLPFVVRPLYEGLRAIPDNIIESAYTLGASPIDTFFYVILPNIKSAFLNACLLGFAHTVGEFGVILMIGGNIPGKTQVLSISIYEHVENLNYNRAHILSAGLLLFSFIVVLFVNITSGNHRTSK